MLQVQQQMIAEYKAAGRSKAFQEISMDDFVESMEGIYSETVNEDTRNESPMVYKPKEEILKI